MWQSCWCYHFCGFIIVIIIILLIVVIFSCLSLVTLKSIFFGDWRGGGLVSISLPCSHFFHDLFIKPSFAISVSVKLTVCSNTAVSESASGRGDKWHMAPLALIERCQRSVSSCCHQRLCSPQTSRSALHHTRPRVNVLPRHSLYHISKGFYFQELIYLSSKKRWW